MPLGTCTILITGRVQGVFYRASAAEEARSLGLAGWIRNLPGGTVEAVATGERETVDRFVAWCRRGPPSARVDAVDVRWHDEPTVFEGFRVRRG